MQFVTARIPNFATVYTVNHGAQVITVMLMILVLIFQRIVASLTAGAVKG